MNLHATSGRMRDACDLAIIGGGPCALAIVLRLAREAGAHSCTPEGLDTRRRAQELLARTVIIDASGSGFLTLWRRKLLSQGVATLRSPTFVHPHASRVMDDALARYGIASGRQRELVLLPDAQPWTAPAAQLFDDFCACALEEIRSVCPTLCERIVHGRVTDILPLVSGGLELHCRLAKEESADLQVALPIDVPTWDVCIRASHVVLAVGDGDTAAWPDWAVQAKGSAPPGRLLHSSQLATSHSATPMVFGDRHPGCRGHVTSTACTRPGGKGCAYASSPAPLATSSWWAALAAIARRLSLASWEMLPAALPAARPAECARPLGKGQLLVIGGGLSAAHLACEAVRCGWTHVTLVARHRMAVRPFDIDVAWMRRHLSAELEACEAEFFAACPAERRALLRKARPGGSLTRASLADLDELRRRGQLELLEEAYVLEACWSAKHMEGAWIVSLIRGGVGGTTSLVVDAIWLATGARLDVADVPVLQSLLHAQPQPTHGGLAELTPSLRWNEMTPLYISGALAALQLGPDAFNLAGAGQGASRIISDLCGTH